MKIEIDDNPFATDYYYNGRLTQENRVYDFQIHDTESHGKLVYWITDIPTNEEDELEVINSKILKEYNNR